MFFDGTLEESTEIALAMPMDVRFESDAQAITPLGPRDMGWLKKTSEDPWHGIDFFAWWEPGLNAKYLIGRALIQMWAEIRWRPPVNDVERKSLKEVHEALLRAYRRDENLGYPWDEWAEILNLLGLREPEFGFVHERSRSSPSIGYRRSSVTTELPGRWLMRIPGSFSEFVSSEGDAFLSESPPKAIWFTGYRFTEPGSAGFEHWRGQMGGFEKEYTEERDDYIGFARIKQNEENGRKYFILESSNIGPRDRCVCTIIYLQPEEREWALAVWRSLKPPQA